MTTTAPTVRDRATQLKKIEGPVTNCRGSVVTTAPTVSYRTLKFPEMVRPPSSLGGARPIYECRAGDERLKAKGSTPQLGSSL